MARTASLSSMSVDTLLKLRDDIGKVLIQKTDQLRDQLSKLSGEVDLGKGRRVRRSGMKGRKVAVKYRDGSGNTWAGRGAQPVWLREKLKAGAKLEDFAVEKTCSQSFTEEIQEATQGKGLSDLCWQFDSRLSRRSCGANQLSSLGRVRPLAPNGVLEAEQSWREQPVFQPHILAWPASRPARVAPSWPPGLSKLLPLAPPLSLKTPWLAEQARGARSIAGPSAVKAGLPRAALGRAQVLCGRLAGPSICNNVE